MSRFVLGADERSLARIPRLSWRGEGQFRFLAGTLHVTDRRVVFCSGFWARQMPVILGAFPAVLLARWLALSIDPLLAFVASLPVLLGIMWSTQGLMRPSGMVVDLPREAVTGVRESRLGLFRSLELIGSNGTI